MKTIIDALIELLSSLFDGIGEVFETDHTSDAKFGKASKLISKSHKGWSVDGKRFLDLKTSRQNFCVVAGSGRGKTQVHIYPTILNTTASMVVNDNSGELEKCVPYLKSKGTNTLVMNLMKKGDVYLNPLDGCKGDVSAMRKISKALVSNASKESGFFETSAEDCLSLFIQYVLESEPRVYANLGNVFRLLMTYQGEPQVIERLMADKASEDVWVKFKALAGNSERTLKSILSTAISALSWLGDNPTLVDITSITTINFQNFRQTPHCLLIQSPVSDAKFYAPMVAMIFESFYRFTFATLPSDDDLDIMMILDEFSSLINGLPDYSNTISNSRKFKIPQCIVLQDESLLSPYKELKDNILGNCFVKIYHGGQDKKAFELEKLLGTYSYTDKETKQKVKRPLMMANEIREMDGEVLVIPSGQKPLKVKTTPAYKQSKLRRQLAMELPQNEEDAKSIDYSIQYIDLTNYREQSKTTV